MPKKIELHAGKKFNKLTVVSLDHKEINKYNNTIKTRDFYLCKCECGKNTIVEKWNLITGHTFSCGCMAKHNNLKHNKTNSLIYRRWTGMKNRCYNKNEPTFYRYGGRGITVCDEWKNDFMSFYNWAIANGYKDDLTLDRINNDGNYEPSNCRWVDVKTQSRNRCSNKFITYKGHTLCIADWSKKTGIRAENLYYRIKKGWPVEKALNNY